MALASCCGSEKGRTVNRLKAEKLPIGDRQPLMETLPKDWDPGPVFFNESKKLIDMKFLCYVFFLFYTNINDIKV